MTAVSPHSESPRYTRPSCTLGSSLAAAAHCPPPPRDAPRGAAAPRGTRCPWVPTACSVRVLPVAVTKGHLCSSPPGPAFTPVVGPCPALSSRAVSGDREGQELGRGPPPSPLSTSCQPGRADVEQDALSPSPAPDAALDQQRGKLRPQAIRFVWVSSAAGLGLQSLSSRSPGPASPVQIARPCPAFSAHCFRVGIPHSGSCPLLCRAHPHPQEYPRPHLPPQPSSLPPS